MGVGTRAPRMVIDGLLCCYEIFGLGAGSEVVDGPLQFLCHTSEVGFLWFCWNGASFSIAYLSPLVESVGLGIEK